MRYLVSIPGLTHYPGPRGPEWARDLGPDEILDLLRHVDELGLDFVNVSTHFAMHESLVETMGPVWPHSLSASGILLGATSRIQVFCKVVVPYHRPIELAKALATLDVMSGERLVPVPLVGYMEWEFDLVGEPIGERGSITDEYVAAMIELWTAERPRFSGKRVSFADIAFEPRPRRELPLWFGGRAKAALRRVARYGHGWVSYATPHVEIPAMIDYIRSQPEFERRKPSLEVYANLVERTRDLNTHADPSPPTPLVGAEAIIDRVGRLSELGVTITTADVSGGRGPGDGPATSAEEWCDRMSWFAEEVMGPTR